MPAGPRAALRMPVRGVAATGDAAVRTDTARYLTSAVRSAGENAGAALGCRRYGGGRTRRRAIVTAGVIVTSGRERPMHAPVQRTATAARGLSVGEAADVTAVRLAAARAEGAKHQGGRGAGAAAGRVDGSSTSGAGADAPSREARWGHGKNVEAILAEARTASDRRGKCRCQAAIITGMPSCFALSTRLPVMPEPGNAMTPLGSRLSRSSLRRKGAALP